MRRILALWLERWPTDRLRRRRHFEQPLVTVATIGSRRVVLAVDREAALAGMAPGMTLADARARLPEVMSVEADPADDAASLTRLADWCTRYTPWTAVADESTIWLDITGAVPLFASEQVLADDLLARLRGQGIAARASVADTPGCAWAVARFSACEEGPAVVVPVKAMRDALATLPAAALRLPDGIAGDLRRLGLRRIGQLYPIPRAPLAPRFGEIVAKRLDQALGLVSEPLSPQQPVEPRIERQVFAEPIGTAEDIERSIGWLATKLCQRLERAALGVRTLELACYRVDGEVQRIRIGTSLPNRDPLHLKRLMAARIETIDPGFGIELVLLVAVTVAPLVPGQIGLEAGAAAGGSIDQLVDRLSNRLGPANVLRLAPRDSHVPERAQRLVPAFERVPTGEWFNGRPRPIRLLRHPDPIEAMAPVPDEPPVTFRWRKQTHRVRHAEGPERIAAEWWRMPDMAIELMPEEIRDYYRLEDEAGYRYWVYRRGFYRQGVSPRWFLHGFFA